MQCNIISASAVFEEQRDRGLEHFLTEGVQLVLWRLLAPQISSLWERETREKRQRWVNAKRAGCPRNVVVGNSVKPGNNNMHWGEMHPSDTLGPGMRSRHRNHEVSNGTHVLGAFLMRTLSSSFRPVILNMCSAGVFHVCHQNLSIFTVSICTKLCRSNFYSLLQRWKGWEPMV